MPGSPLTPTEFASAVSAITSACGDPTRREIYLFAHQREGGVTASEVAEQFDLHPNVARHHLDKLAGGSYLEVEVGRLPNGGAGRPSKRYRATSESVSFELPIRHDDLLVTLLGRALALLPPDQAETMAEEVGAEYGRVMAAALGPGSPKSFRAALHAVADALSSHGFAAHTEAAGITTRDEQGRLGLRLVSEHCPFGGAAVEHPVICAVDRGMVKGMLGALYGDATTETMASLPFGDDICVTVVEG